MGIGEVTNYFHHDLLLDCGEDFLCWIHPWLCCEVFCSTINKSYSLCAFLSPIVLCLSARKCSDLCLNTRCFIQRFCIIMGIEVGG